mmetsp:Transcript_26111/g.34300  ORF Transcript_26111/g.34300 Transcript_26111/m.34300 type:complete len:254 (-) Transcript_26111:191-952(-)|eukprot:CAMPEP_0117755872 /NCGR_PEP_ID=MMETSP0947-20121206/13712_1 /TAXON_ID=44440 /ORGANISM="Chattonella subsalsa, Strain CCMP2191" /LENGTH=253 /DNA_ID=CAMNT_0005575293 /DNA_START=128 /DNA_END=889 /DNA_ORIENTATION=-
MSSILASLVGRTNQIAPYNCSLRLLQRVATNPSFQHTTTVSADILLRQNSSLSSVLKNELTEEKENNLKMPEDLDSLHESIKKTLTLREDFGNGLVSICGHMKSPPPGEKVTVEFTAGVAGYGLDEEFEEEAEGEEQQAEEDEDYTGDFPSEKDFVVTVAKGSEKLLFYCRALDTIAIDGVTHIPAGKDSVDDLYEGPEFDELDPSLQEAFIQYLEERGINSNLGAWVVMYADYKEQREYMNWLEKVQSFVEK